MQNNSLISNKYAEIPINPPKPTIRALTPCKHLGPVLNKTAPCIDDLKDELKVFACKIYGECTITNKGKDVTGCCWHKNGKCKGFTRD